MTASAERPGFVSGAYLERAMQHAADRFERTEPAELRRVPFHSDELEMVPNAFEAIGWVVLAFAAGSLFVGFLGL